MAPAPGGCGAAALLVGGSVVLENREERQSCGQGTGQSVADLRLTQEDPEIVNRENEEQPERDQLQKQMPRLPEPSPGSASEALGANQFLLEASGLET